MKRAPAECSGGASGPFSEAAFAPAACVCAAAFMSMLPILWRFDPLGPLQPANGGTGAGAHHTAQYRANHDAIQTEGQRGNTAQHMQDACQVEAAANIRP